MISVAEARARIVSQIAVLPAEQVAVTEALGRVLAADVVARRTQPPTAVSAMDGYAVRAEDVAAVPAELRVVGAAPAGGAFDGRVGAGEAVRIFTGGPVPDGADAIVIQEDVDRDGERITVREGAAAGTYVRPAGLDFAAGDVGLRAGRVLSPRDVAFAAAMDHPWLAVRRRPRVALLASGDEIVRPGEPIGPNQIVSSNTLGLAAFVRSCGGEAIDLGIAPDTIEGLKRLAAGARGADLLITTGGASVGEHDLVARALAELGLDLDFWKIAMRPGKPLMSGRIGEVPMLGLPGNPVSTMVCAEIFLRPAIAALLGLEHAPRLHAASAATAIAANDRREDYLRSTLSRGDEGRLLVTPFARQDSSMLSRLALADCLLVRAPHAPALPAGAPVEILPLIDLDSVR